MGFYYNGTLYDWATPSACCRFPGLTLVEKLRYGMHLLACQVDHRLAPPSLSQLDRVAPSAGSARGCTT